MPNDTPDWQDLPAAGFGRVLFDAVVPTAGGLAQANFSVPTVSVIHTLVIKAAVAAGQTVTRISVAGGSSGLVYRDGPPYLPQSPGGGGIWIAVVRILPSVDTSFVVNVYTVAAIATIEVVGDALVYDESSFYNGTIQAAQQETYGAGTYLLVDGPCRLLTAALEVSGAGLGQIFIPGENILRVDSSAGQTVLETLTFPPNTILPAGSSLSLSSNASTVICGNVTYAYP